MLAGASRPTAVAHCCMGLALVEIGPLKARYTTIMRRSGRPEILGYAPLDAPTQGQPFRGRKSEQTISHEDLDLEKKEWRPEWRGSSPQATPPTGKRTCRGTDRTVRCNYTIITCNLHTITCKLHDEIHYMPITRILHAVKFM